MVIRPRKRRGGWLSVDMVVAMGLLLIVVLPLAYSFAHERRLARIYYWQAISMEIVDGEFETLRAGAWREYAPGTHPYPVQARAAANLPPGEFRVTRAADFIRLEWVPSRRHSGTRIVREVPL